MNDTIIKLPFDAKCDRKRMEYNVIGHYNKIVGPRFNALSKLMYVAFIQHFGTIMHMELQRYVFLGRELTKNYKDYLMTPEYSHCTQSKIMDSIFNRHQLLHGNLKIYNQWIKKQGMLQFYYDDQILNDHSLANLCRQAIYS